jgi:hypothetical protein
MGTGQGAGAGRIDLSAWTGAAYSMTAAGRDDRLLVTSGGRRYGGASPGGSPPQS